VGKFVVPSAGEAYNLLNSEPNHEFQLKTQVVCMNEKEKEKLMSKQERNHCVRLLAVACFSLALRLAIVSSGVVAATSEGSITGGGDR